MQDYLMALIGGAMIGLSATIMLLFNGRITGISGIINGSLASVKNSGDEKTWRWFFLAGLLLGGYAISELLKIPKIPFTESDWLISLGGFFVGLGTLIGSGCTSGHGVCGISRLSTRSIVATVHFIFWGVVTVYIINHILGLRG